MGSYSLSTGTSVFSLMNISPIFCVNIGVFDVPEILPLARKIFSDNQHILKVSQRIRSNFYLQNTNKYLINEDYKYPEDVEKFKQIILEHGLSYLKHEVIDYYMDDYIYEVRNLWLNEMSAGNFQTVHRHPGYVLSGCYYVDIPDDCSPIEFHSPYPNFLPDYFNNPNRNYSPFNSSFWKMHPTEGQMLFWFSELQHSVPALNSGIRRSIPFDITVKDIKDYRKKEYFQ